jgi:hypothetical protein
MGALTSRLNERDESII